MEIVWLTIGVALLALVFADALWTTLWVDGGAGPLTSRLTARAWRAMLAVVGRRRHSTLSLFGPAIIVAIASVWVLLLWAGWVFVYSSEPTSLLISSNPEVPVNWTGRIWFVAYAISTMGNGDHMVNGDVWQMTASLTTLSGFALATLVISYLLSVLGAVVDKRAFAGQVASIGTTAEEFLENAWNGRDFTTLDLPLSSISNRLSELTEQYLSYPVLQYYHAARPPKSPAVGLIVLDEALTLLRFGIVEEARPSKAVLRSARAGVASYLETLENAFIDPADETPPPPNLERLRAAGIPLVSSREFQGALDDLQKRRAKLLGLLRTDGWNWTDQ